MTVTAGWTNRYVERPAPSRLADVVDVVLDRGVVVDVAARVSLLGLEVVFVDARMVMVSLDSYLPFAEAVQRLDVSAT